MALEGRTALVTGAGGQGMGRSIALTLAREGANVVLNYRRNAEQAVANTTLVEKLGRAAIAVRADVTIPAEVDAMFAVAHERFGRVDIVVNSAGGPWKPQDVTEIAPEHLRRVLAGEIEATYYLLRAALPGMRERGWGRFVSIGGQGVDDWRFGPPEAPLDYPLGKAARHWLTRTLAPREFPHGITINAVAPGPTPRMSEEDALAAARGGVGAPAGHTAQSVAEVVAYLCSEAGARVTGAVVPVPGVRAV